MRVFNSWSRRITTAIAALLSAGLHAQQGPLSPIGPRDGDEIRVAYSSFDPALPQRIFLSKLDDDRLYLACDRRLYLFRFSQRHAFPHTPIAGFLPGTILDLAESQSGALWIGTTRGLAGDGAPELLARRLEGASVSRVLLGGDGSALLIVSGKLFVFIAGVLHEPQLAGMEGGGRIHDAIRFGENRFLTLGGSGRTLTVNMIQTKSDDVRELSHFQLESIPGLTNTPPGPMNLSPQGRLVLGAVDSGIVFTHSPGDTGTIRSNPRPLPLQSREVHRPGVGSRSVLRIVTEGDGLWFVHGWANPGVSRWIEADFRTTEDVWTGDNSWRQDGMAGLVTDLVILPDGNRVLATAQGLQIAGPAGERRWLLEPDGPGQSLSDMADLDRGGGRPTVAGTRGVFGFDSLGVVKKRIDSPTIRIERTPVGDFAIVDGELVHMLTGNRVTDRPLAPVSHFQVIKSQLILAVREDTALFVDPTSGAIRSLLAFPGPVTHLLAHGDQVIAGIGSKNCGLWRGETKLWSNPPIGSSPIQGVDLEGKSFIATAPVKGMFADGPSLFAVTNRSLLRLTRGRLETLIQDPAASLTGGGIWGDRIALGHETGRITLLDRQGTPAGSIRANFLAHDEIIEILSHRVEAWLLTRHGGLQHVQSTPGQQGAGL